MQKKKLNNDIHHANSRCHKKIYIKEQLNALLYVIINTSFWRTRQIINFMKSATSNKNNNKCDRFYCYYSNSNKITIMRGRIEVFFWRISAVFGVFRSF